MAEKKESNNELSIEQLKTVGIQVFEYFCHYKNANVSLTTADLWREWRKKWLDRLQTIPDGKINDNTTIIDIIHDISCIIHIFEVNLQEAKKIQADLLEEIQSINYNPEGGDSINIILNEVKRKNILESLIKKLNVDLVIDPIKSQLTPGNFIKFNYFFEENKISINDDYLKNLGNLLNLYKKDKQIIFIDLILFLTNSYFDNLNNKKLFTNEKIVEYKRFVFENINKFFLYNLNQNALLNTINIKINEK